MFGNDRGKEVVLFPVSVFFISEDHSAGFGVFGPPIGISLHGVNAHSGDCLYSILSHQCLVGLLINNFVGVKAVETIVFLSV